MARASALRPHSWSEAFVLRRKPQVVAAPRTWRPGSGARGAASGVRPGREGPHGVGQHAVRLALGRTEGARAARTWTRTGSPTRPCCPRSSDGPEAGRAAHRAPAADEPALYAEGRAAGSCPLEEVSSLYLQTWRSGETLHGSLKADLHHWSANSLGSFLCGRGVGAADATSRSIWRRSESSRKRSASGRFIRSSCAGCSRSGRAGQGSRIATSSTILESALERRLQRRVRAGGAGEGRGTCWNARRT